MTNRENFISIVKRKGFERIPVSFSMCPSLAEKYNDYVKEHPLSLNRESSYASGLPVKSADAETFKEKFYADKCFKKGTYIDSWGVAHEPGSAAAFHMTYMHHPMENFDSVEQIREYPMPAFDYSGVKNIAKQAANAHANGSAITGSMQCTVWETAWYMRGMENLMCDMMNGDDMATVLLDRVTDIAVTRAEAFAEAGCDALFLGDDVGMQHTIMLSAQLYDEWLKPRLKKVINAARKKNPDIIILYHTCGHVTELIPNLIDAGIDVLDPVQPECMEFKEIHEKFGDRLSFHGTIGTQSVMPFGTPDEVRRKVFENLDIAGGHGGLLVCPTHLLEPEVPLENILAYIKACENYCK